VSRELQIEEYQMPLRAADLPFWLAAAALIAAVFVLRHRLREYARADRVLMIGALALAVAAATAARNVGFFAVIAAPALSRMWPSRREPAMRRRPRPLGAAGAWMCLAAALGGVGLVSFRWRGSGAHLGWQPMSSAALEAVRGCPDRIFNHLMDGGFLMWELPDRRVFVDSRMEAYPLRVLRASRQADVYGEFETTFEQYGINCAVVATGVPLYSKLADTASMRRIFVDGDRAVFVRSEAGAARGPENR
jgi:hypothetical protein